MVEISDTPWQANGHRRSRRLEWVSVALIFMGLASLAGGADQSVLVGTIEGLDVKAEFLGRPATGANRTVVYKRGGEVAYRVTVQNKGNLSFRRVELQASLHTDGVTCPDLTLNPGNRLPGNSLSPFRAFGLSPQASYEVEAAYDIPPDFCPSTGQLHIRVQYFLRDNLRAATLIAPIRFQIE